MLLKAAALLSLIFIVNGLVPLHVHDEDVRIEGQYVVLFNANSTDSQLSNLMDKLILSGVSVIHNYNFEGFRGVAVKLSPEQLDALRQEDLLVQIVEEDKKISIECVTQDDPIWNLARVSNTKVGGTTYNYADNAGEGVVSYVVDTGIRITHNEFKVSDKESRAIWGDNFVDSDDTDCNGHGTHVAGTIAGKTYGIAKKAQVVAVKVLDCDGSGTNSGVIKGVEFTATDCKGRKCNANMSLGGGKSTVLDQAVARAVASGVSFIVAAGNDNQNACNYSPANEPTAISVGATDGTDRRASFSNYGNCVDVFGPGVSIKSAWYTSDTATSTISGTSMAAPHVAGVVTLIQGNEASRIPPATLFKRIQDIALDGVINLNCASSACNASPNLLLHNDC